jgi:hypothetical protein
MAVAAGRTERAPRLAGACTASRERLRAIRHPIWKTLLGRAGVPIERSADAPQLAAVWDCGWGMSREEALADATSEETEGG